MANHASAEKASRQSRQRRERNRVSRASLRTAIKRLRTAIDSKNVEEIQKLLPITFSRIDKTAKTGVQHANSADRQKARLAARAAAVLTPAR